MSENLLDNLTTIKYNALSKFYMYRKLSSYALWGSSEVGLIKKKEIILQQFLNSIDLSCMSCLKQIVQNFSGCSLSNMNILFL